MPLWLVLALMFLFFAALVLATMRFFTVQWRKDLERWAEDDRKDLEIEEMREAILSHRVPPGAPGENWHGAPSECRSRKERPRGGRGQ